MHKAINIGLALMIPAMLIAGEVADWSVGGGTAKLDESSGAITLTVDTVSATTISGSPTISSGAVSATSVTASGKVSSYGYPAVVGHTNGSAQVYMTQSGAVTGGAGATTYTQAFTVAFIAVPNVVVTPTVAAGVTNGLYISSIASNQFLVVTDDVGTNFQWIAHGRIK